MPFAPVEGGQLHYRFDGRQDLPVLVLSNSLGTDLSMWDAQVPRFTQHFRVLRYDSYGHGASTFAAGGFRIDRLGQMLSDCSIIWESRTFRFAGYLLADLSGSGWASMPRSN